MTHTKSEWRTLLLRARGGLSDVTRRDSSAAIVRRLGTLPQFAGSASLLLYAPIGAEVDVRGLVTVATAVGKAIYLPLQGESPAWTLQLPGAHPGAPRADAFPERPALVIVPGVGFDVTGVRLGRGGGFYDRALAGLRRVGGVFAVGVAFESQIAPWLPRDSWDQCVDLVMTESRAIVPMLHPEREVYGR